MHFALLGNHPDGLAMAGCLVASGRHQLITYTSASAREEVARLGCAGAKLVTDLEEVLADPAVEFVIVASGPANRATHLRRALQSERHVLCVHPPDPGPDLAHEAAMIRDDTGKVLLPLLHEGLHPALARLGELLASGKAQVGTLRLLTLDVRSPGPVLLAAGVKEHRLSAQGWQVLRRLGGEIPELSAFALGEELALDQALLVAGRFENGGLFQAALLPDQPEASWRLTAEGTRGSVELLFPIGQPGPGFLSWRDLAGEDHEDAWDVWDPWPALVEIFETAVAGRPTSPVSWRDCVRSLELDDAARRSVERRRASTLEYPEATEEVGFKGTMTLVGCGLVWLLIIVLVLANWFRWMFWLIAPVLAGFLALQLLRWIIPDRPRPDDTQQPKGESEP